MSYPKLEAMVRDSWDLYMDTDARRYGDKVHACIEKRGDRHSSYHMLGDSMDSALKGLEHMVTQRTTPQ